MAIYLTDGKYYIRHNSTGAVVKTTDISEAQDFYSVERAINQKNKAPGKCSGYYYITMDNLEGKPIKEPKQESKGKDKCKRKNFSAKHRKIIYRKTKGRCYLCGEFVDFDSFEIEHNIPLAKGGTNDLSNLFPSCHCCNTMKNSIYPRDFLEKVKQIYLYQTEKRLGGSVRWKIIRYLLA